MKRDNNFVRPYGYAYYDRVDRNITVSPISPKRFQWIYEDDPGKRLELFLKYSRSAQLNGTLLPAQTSIISEASNCNAKLEAPLPQNSQSKESIKSLSERLSVYAEDIVPITEVIDGYQTVFTGTELLNMDTSEIIPLIDPLLPKHEISFLAAKGDTGKSLLAQQIMLSIVLRKKECFGMTVNADYYSVIFVSTEENIKRIAERVKKQVKAMTDETPILDKLIFRVVKNDLFNFLNITLLKQKADLVIIDPFGEVIEGDENSQKDVRDYMYHMELLIKKHNCSILFLGHLRKTAGNNPSRLDILGSTAIADRARNVFLMTKDHRTDIRTIKIDKSNNLSEEVKRTPIRLELDPESLTFQKQPNYNVSKNIDSETPSTFVVNALNENSLKENHIANNKPGRKPPWDLIKIAFDLKEKGSKQDEISHIVKRDKSTVSKWLNNPKYIQWYQEQKDI